MSLPVDLAALQLLGDYSRNQILPQRQHLVYQRIDQHIGSSALLALAIEASCDRMNQLAAALRMHHQNKIRWDPQQDMVEYVTPFCQIHSILHAVILLQVEDRYRARHVVHKANQLVLKQVEVAKLYRDCGLDEQTANQLLILDGRQVIDQDLCSARFLFHSNEDLADFQAHSKAARQQPSSPKN